MQVKIGDYWNGRDLYVWLTKEINIPAEDQHAIILRLHEYQGQRDHILLHSDSNIRSWQECDLMENPIGEKYYQNEVKFYIRPYEIKTFLIEFDR
ncbi:glycosyl hydrolase-related protein [Gracilibacillus sp. D59]|uniref:glycosyl hydrolase-related protein n=1 Tax=Gracilibacillus sp. D59 TaxID=3457434 RepID=UPI003FCCE468